jgi:hypothetical protein
MMVVLILGVSCSASKQNGFSYRPAYAGPSVSGSVEANTTPEELKSQPSPVPEEQAVVQSLAVEEHAIAADLAVIVDRQMSSQPPTEKVDARKAVTEISEAYAEKNNIHLSEKQLRKLDRYAAQLEKKQQKKADVEWGPQNNLEIFLLAAAGVGLVVGFFSAIGWFVFLVAALVYLYLKLLKD